MRSRAIIAGIVCATVLLGGAAVALSLRASHRINRVPLSDSPRLVMTAAAERGQYRDSRTYVGAARPWVEADVGPQFVSAYVVTVLVRPGAVVRSGQVLATLDCANPSAATRAAKMEAQAINERLRAAADEAKRISSLADGGFAAPNEAEQKLALSAADLASLQASKANLLKSSLYVRDCVLRAPFDGEVATRSMDPGSFARPGNAIVSVVDRGTVRVTVDAPEKDFSAVLPGTLVEIEMVATDSRVTAPIARTAPKADPKTRTVHFEVDLPDPKRQYPVDTTALVHVEVGSPVAATRIPIYAATQASGKARLFVVEGSIAHARTLPVLGESGGALFFKPDVLPAGSAVVVEGRALLSEGDKVSAKTFAPAENADLSERRGGGYGRPL